MLRWRGRLKPFGAGDRRSLFFFFQAEDGIRDGRVTGVQTCALPIYLILAERKIMAHMQARVGPNRVGPFGMLQPIADVLKLFFKEEFIPAGANKVDRKSTRLNSSHPSISYAVFCLKKKKKKITR